MRILHYVLGIPPVRGGGLIKYAFDIANEQVNSGHNVGIIYPGHFESGSCTRVKEEKSKNGIVFFEIINPLPVPMGKGILEVEPFVKKVDKGIFYKFFKDKKIEILHIHSFMGLYRELIEAAKGAGVKIVFTSHDYFGLCPKPDMFYGQAVCQDNFGKNCQECCNEAYSLNRIRKEQAILFKYYKSSRLIEYLKKYKRLFELVQKVKVDNDKKNHINKCDVVQQVDYRELDDYYKSMFKLVDKFHFNSNIAKEEYEKRLDTVNGEVISITHGGISDHRKAKKCDGILKIAYLGPCSVQKGFFMLLRALEELYENNQSFELNVYFDERPTSAEFVKYNAKYSYKELNDVMDNIDIVVVPSLWRETFGLVVVEALSYGIPVIVTENVGAKDLIADETFGMCIKPQKEALKKAVNFILNNKEKIEQLSNNIIEKYNVKEMKQHMQEIEELYCLLINEK